MSESPQNRAAGTTFVERRAHPRRRAESLIYVGFGDENGGIVLDLSEGGMGFHAANPIEQFHFPKVKFQLPLSQNWAEAAGDVAWMNEARTAAGLKFIDLPEEARAEIREWVNGKASAARPMVANEAEEIGKAPRSPRVRVSPRVPMSRPVAPSVVEHEIETPVQPPVQTPDKLIEAPPPPVSIEVGQSEAAAQVETVQEFHEEAFEIQSKAAVLYAQAGAEWAEIPDLASRLDESHEIAEGSELPSTGAVERVTEVAVSQDSPASSAVEDKREEEREAAATAEEDEIVATAIAHAPVNSEEPPYLIPSEVLGESTLEEAKENSAAVAGTSFEWERLQADAPERKLSGWAIAAIFVGTVAISFSAGWAVGHGFLNPWIHTSADTMAARTVPAASTPPGSVVPLPAAPGGTTAPNGQPTGGAPPSLGPAATSTSSSPTATTESAPEHAASMDVSTPTGEESPNVDIPEEPISASSTIAMSATRSVEIPAAAGSSTRPGSTHVVPGDLVSHVQPDYPAQTMQEQVEGTVKLRVTVGKDGSIKQIEPMGGPPALVGTSVAAVRQWRYKPTYVNQKPVEVQEIVKIVFRLPQSSAAPAGNP